MMEPMSQARVDASVPTLRLPVVPVTVVVVTRGLSDYLPRTLEALAGQTRPPEQVLLVDAAADATDGPGTLLTELISRLWPDADVDVSVLAAPGARTMGGAGCCQHRHVHVRIRPEPGDQLGQQGPGSIGGVRGGVDEQHLFGRTGLAGCGRGRVGAGSTRRADDGRRRAGRPRRGGAPRTDAGPGLALAAARRQRAGADGARGAVARRGAGPVGRPRGLQAAHLVRPGTGARGRCVDLPVRPTDDRAGRARGGPGPARRP